MWNNVLFGVLQKHVQRRNCEIPVKFSFRRGAWQILNHPISWLTAIIWDPFPGLNISLQPGTAAVEERWFLTVAQKSWPQFGNRAGAGGGDGDGGCCYEGFFFSLLFFIHTHFKEWYFRGLVSYGRNVSAWSLEKKKEVNNVHYVIKMSWEVYCRYVSFKMQSCLYLTCTFTCQIEANRDRGDFFFLT